MATNWTDQEERSNLLALRFMAWVARRLGRQAARLLLVPISLYFLLAVAPARRASKRYLRQVLGRKPRVIDLYRHFFCFAATILDRVFLLNNCFDQFDIRIHGRDIVQKALAEGTGAFLFGAHLGSFEVIRATGQAEVNGIEALHASMVMYPDNARKLNRILNAINPDLKQRIIALGHADSMLRVKDALDQGELVGLLCDRSVGHKNAHEQMLSVPFLGDHILLPRGPFKLAALLKHPVILMVGLYRGGKRYDVYFEQLAGFSEELNRASIAPNIARYAARLEHFCRMAPYNWFNFYDLWDKPVAPDAVPAPLPSSSTESE